MSTWDMARLASKRPLRKPIKMHGPVGEKQDARAPEMVERCKSGYAKDSSSIHLSGEVSTCFGCGYHVCSCERRDPLAMGFPISPELENGQGAEHFPAQPEWACEHRTVTRAQARTGVGCQTCVFAQLAKQRHDAQRMRTPMREIDLFNAQSERRARELLLTGKWER